MVRVYCYVTVVSLQYLTPLILTLNCTLLLKTLGENQPQLSPQQKSRQAGSPLGPRRDSFPGFQQDWKE